jgi:hypothetical protein
MFVCILNGSGCKHAIWGELLRVSWLLNLGTVSYFHDKTTAHLWLELAFYEQTTTRIHIIFAILALKLWSAFFDNISFVVFQLLS